MAQKLPLALRLRKESHRRIAALQDMIVLEIYSIFNNAILHGGTAIWRCHNGSRFSEDLDFYLPKDSAKTTMLFERLEKKGFVIIKKKFSENSIYSELELDRTRIRLEATFQKKSGVLADYENIDGTITSIYSITTEEFIKEKVNAYIKRRKMRDLFDIFFLLQKADETSIYAAKNELEKFIKLYPPPLDEQDLKTLIFEGITPKSTEIIEYIKRKCRR